MKKSLIIRGILRSQFYMSTYSIVIHAHSSENIIYRHIPVNISIPATLIQLLQRYLSFFRKMILTQIAHKLSGKEIK